MIDNARLVMVALVGPLAMIDGEPRQARKGATVTIDSCAGMRLARVATQDSLLALFPFSAVFVLLNGV